MVNWGGEVAFSQTLSVEPNLYIESQPQLFYTQDTLAYQA